MLGNVRLLLKAGASPNGGPTDATAVPATTTTASAGKPLVRPLHMAAQVGSVAVVRELLQAGAVVDLAHEDGATALHWAIRMGQTACVQALLANGASCMPEAGWRSALCACVLARSLP